MALAPGTHLGPYHIADQIGAGGMGEVYRATDSNLGRSVAIKVLPEAFATDADRLARFDREAKTLAALNHPNIAAIYGIEKSGGTTALVMELVEGPTLADRMVDGPIPVDEALNIARQITAALTAAHDKGIIHRDLKPANIKLRPDGAVKVLDFGLAKAIEPAAVMSPGLSVSPTITTPAMTQAGIVLGTAAYMSPEQAKGRPVDKRADIWAFGVVLYESIAGRRPFEGDGVPETLAAIIRDEPALEPIPPHLRPLVRKCLEKDPARRLRDIGDAFALIDAGAIHERSESGSPVRARVWQALALLLAIGVGVAMWAPWRREPPVPETVRFQIPFPEGRTIANFAVSPDGRKVVMQVRTVDGIRLWVRSLESLDTRELPGTETGGNPLFWSPDSRWIVFTTPEGRMKKVDTNGGSVLTICESCGPVVGGSWNADGTIVFGGLNGIMKVSASGGSPVRVVGNAQPSGPRSFAAFPNFLSDGRRFLYARSTEGGTGVFRGSLDGASSDQESVPLVKDTGNAGSGAIGLAPGLHGGDARLLFFRGAALMAQALDQRTLELRGEAVPLAERASFFWVSRDTLVYTAGDGTSRLTWVEDGKAAETVGEPDVYAAIALSPDARRIAAVKRSDTGADLWLLDVRGGRSERLTFTGSIASTSPIWSADGQSIVFSDFGRGTDRIFKKTLNGAAEPALLYASPNSGYATSLSSDGRFLLHVTFDGKTRDIGVISLEGAGDKPQSTRLVSTPFDETDARFSPDGHWIAYKSNETGRTGIYAATFLTGAGTQPPRLGPRYPVSKGGEQIPQFGNTGLFWRADGKAIFYITPKGLMISELTTDPGSPFSDPKLLFPLTFGGGVAGALTSDARRALVAVPSSGSASGITVVLNWQSQLAQ